MNKKNRSIRIVLLLFIQLQLSYAQLSPLSYESFLANVMANHPLSKRAANTKEFGRLQNKAAKGNYDPQVVGDYSNKYYDGTNYYSVLNTELKQAVFTSQFVKVGYDYGMGSNLNPESSTPGRGLPYVGIEVGLLQGLQIDKRRAEVLKSREYIKYFDADQKIQINHLLYESSQSYFNWLFSARQIALNNHFMQVAYQRLIGIEALAKSGEKAAIDTVEASIFYQSRLLDLQNAILDNQQLSNELVGFNWQKNGVRDTSVHYAPEDSLDVYFVKSKNLLSLIMEESVDANPVLSKYTSLQNVLDIDKRLKKEMIKPVLNVNYNFLTLGTSNTDPSLSLNNYKWGVNMAFPLLLRNPTNEFKLSKVVSQNNQLELLDKRNALHYKMQGLKQNMTILIQQLQNAERLTRYNQQLVEAEKLKFTNGESSLFILNARENKLLEAELKLAEYKLKFIKNILTIIYLKGSLSYSL
ncbi:MAG: TolC family protein [bacterium]|nr:TolC family protein [bacterium]